MYRLTLLASATVGIVTLTACQPSPLENDWVEPRPLGGEVQPYQPPKEPASEQATRAATKVSQPTGRLTLRHALSLALKENPELAGFGWEVRAAEARRLQAGLYPNPKAEFEVEEFGGSGPRGGFDGAKTKVRLGQPIPLASKVQKRLRVARFDRKLAGWDYEAKRLDVFTRGVRRFIDVVSAQRRVDVAKRTFDLARQVKKSVSKQVDAGQVSPVEQTRAEVELSRNRIELKSARRALKRSRQALVQTWGGKKPQFEKAVGSLETISSLPTLEALSRSISQNPRLARWTTAMAKRRAKVKLAKARKWPNVTVTGGAEHNAGVNDTTGILSVAMPLPIFDRHQGNVLEARFNVAKARQQRRAARVAVRSMLGQQYQTLADAHQQVTTLREETLPGARSAYKSMRQSYEQGQATLLDVLDAQRTLFDVEGQYVQALAKYHRAAAEVERLIARPLHSHSISANTQAPMTQDSGVTTQPTTTQPVNQ
jgi:cobalt-zinc-cadmium efflux system outer membrane protein